MNTHIKPPVVVAHYFLRFKIVFLVEAKSIYIAYLYVQVNLVEWKSNQSAESQKGWEFRWQRLTHLLQIRIFCGTFHNGLQEM